MYGYNDVIEIAKKLSRGVKRGSCVAKRFFSRKLRKVIRCTVCIDAAKDVDESFMSKLMEVERLAGEFTEPRFIYIKCSEKIFEEMFLCDGSVSCDNIMNIIVVCGGDTCVLAYDARSRSNRL